MADLKQALSWLAEGKMIRKSRAYIGYLQILDNEIVDENGKDSIEGCFELNGDDWEIYEEPEETVLQSDGDYIVWDRHGNRSFAYWSREGGAFFDLQCYGFELAVVEWKKLPERDK